MSDEEEEGLDNDEWEARDLRRQLEEQRRKVDECNSLLAALVMAIAEGRRAAATSNSAHQDDAEAGAERAYLDARLHLGLGPDGEPKEER